MKTNLIRAFVVALAFAGFTAGSVSAKTTVKANTTNIVPTPLCTPGSGDYCGMQ
jgi:hypothetical protein